MATAKKATPKAAATPVVKESAKVEKPAAKAAPKAVAKAPPMSANAKMMAKISASITKLTERKDAIVAQIKALREQRDSLKLAQASTAAPAPTSAPVAAKVKAKAAPKAAAKAEATEAPPAKVAKSATKKK